METYTLTLRVEEPSSPEYLANLLLETVPLVARGQRQSRVACCEWVLEMKKQRWRRLRLIWIWALVLLRQPKGHQILLTYLATSDWCLKKARS